MPSVKKIGRAASNDLVLDYPEISGHHAILTTQPDGSLLLEDLNSSNGTFVNGKKIRSKTIQPSDTIKFAHYQVDLSKLLAAGHQYFAPAKLEYETAFNELKQVYDDYIQSKINITKSTRRTRMVRGFLSFIPMVGSGLGQVSETLMDTQEKLLLLEEDFKVKYCCPACGQFLGNVPWVNLVRKNQCSTCKVQWLNK